MNSEFQIGQQVRVSTHRAQVEQYDGHVGQITAFPVNGIVRVAFGGLNIAFGDHELRAAGNADGRQT